MLSAKKQFTDFISSNKLFKPSDSILLTVSGGKDSVLMATLFAECGYNFAIAHCNFNLRGDESLRDEHFVKALAERLKVPFYLKSFDTTHFAATQKISIQMAARELRYAFFKELQIKENFAKIAVAHHQNDAIETLLINLVRGTGIAGLHGIKTDRDQIIRPLLCFTADEVEAIVQKNNIKYVEDSSNASNKYMRNKLRLDIIPQLEQLNPSLAQTFKENIAYFSQLEDLLNNRVADLKSRLITTKNGNIQIKIPDILALNPPQLLLFELLKPYGFNATQIDNLLHCLNGGSGKQFFSEKYVLNLDRDYIEISIFQKPETVAEAFISTLGNYDFNAHQLSVKNVSNFPKHLTTTNSIYVDAEKLIFPLKLRYWQQGDFFKPFGMRGFKKLSDFFINQKIPLQQKTQIPILVNGNEEIIWICGFRSDERYKVDLNSKKIITFGLHK
ncbi:tRNA lysidine(34) synthetase TilS [Pedobacter arcticus]|uniref:tRNA lysidine(34) synthetase TilS n=1 Tax=Pedobacter arcticus TaxID=752140 RepID=UPI00030F24CD|nr:tRNA lysidine(34) synthetase TilS [Pedobacter arcticus]